MADAREALKKSGYRMSFLAEELGIDSSTLYRFKNGKSKLGKPALILLCQKLGLDTEALKRRAS